MLNKQKINSADASLKIFLKLILGKEADLSGKLNSNYFPKLFPKQLVKGRHGIVMFRIECSINSAKG
jgi:hypothetical protein